MYKIFYTGQKQSKINTGINYNTFTYNSSEDYLQLVDTIYFGTKGSFAVGSPEEREFHCIVYQFSGYFTDF